MRVAAQFLLLDLAVTEAGAFRDMCYGKRQTTWFEGPDLPPESPSHKIWIEYTRSAERRLSGHLGPLLFPARPMHVLQYRSGPVFRDEGAASKRVNVPEQLNPSTH